jgi:two-component system, cell cycle sensor histidine kinase and response regulator CckA
MHENNAPTLRAPVLGQLLLMQSVLCSLPDEKSIFSFVLRGLTDIPGVAEAGYSVTPTEKTDESQVRLPLHVGTSNRGEISIKVSDPLAFAPYAVYLKNFCFMVAVVLEERHQHRLNEEHRTQLEQRVQERTNQLTEDIAERRLVEEALLRAKKDWETIFQAIGHPTIIMDLEHRIVAANKATIDLSGKSLDQLVNTKCYALFHNSNEPPGGCPMQALLKSGSLETVEMEMEALGGYYLVSCSPFSDAAGKVQGVIHIATDITERKRVEEAARIEKRRFEAFAENSPFGLVMIDDEGMFLYANPKFQEMFGYGLKDVPNGKEWFRKAYPESEYRHQVIAAWLEDLASSGLGEQRPRVFTVTCKDGRKKIVHFRPVQLQKAEHLMTCEDITDRVYAERALSEHAAMLENILEKAADGICIGHNTSEPPYVRFTHWNPRMEEITGYTKAEINQSGWYQTMYPDPDTQRRVAERMFRIREGDDVRAEKRIVTKKDGTKIMLSISSSVLREENGRTHILALMQDITKREQAEEKLRKNQVMLASVLNSVPQSIFWKDRDSVYLGCNHVFAMAVGLESPDQIVGKTDFDLPRPRDEAEAYRVEDQEVMTSNKAKRHIVEPLQQADGTRLWIDTTKVPLVDQNNNVYGVLGVYEDITEQKMKEEALLESEERFRLTFQTSPDSININRLSDGLYLDVNDGFLAITGYSREEVIGKSSLELDIWHNPQDRQRLVESLQEAGYVPNLEAKFRFKDGTVITGLMSARVIMLKGEPHIVSITRNIEEWRRTQEALRKSEQQYRSLFEESIDGVYSVLRDGEITDANPSFLKLFGYSRYEMIGKDIRNLYIDPSDRPRLQEEIEKKGFLKDYEVKFRKKDGTEFDCLITSSVQFGDDGSVVGYRGIMRNLTIRKALQKQLFQAQKMEAIGTLAGGIAHDFNNLLQIILGYSELVLLDQTEKDKRQQELQAIRQAATRGADLVRQILTFSRRVETNPRPINLNAEVKQAQKLLSRTIPKMIDIQLLLADDLQTINADPGQIEQILLNLAVNAQHAMPEGGKIVIQTENVILDFEYCETHLDVKPGDYALLTVSDTGHGMEKEVLDHIFEPFYSTKKTGQGTGLGLAMVFGIVKGHGGHIECYSEPDEGTTFRIYLPALEAVEGSDVGTSQEMPAFGTETILLVDDEALIMELGKRILSRAGYTVLTASNGKEALEVYESRKSEIALVILDLIMPEMGGLECLKELLRIDPEARVLIASGYSAESLPKETTEGGAVGFTGKPYKMKEMLRVVRKLLDADR